MVIYDDDTSLKRTLSACDRLVKSLWSKVDFDFRWWRTRFLADPDLAAGAASEAAEADLFIVSSSSDEEASAKLKSWLGDWSQIRSGRMGALANLTGSVSPNAGKLGQSENILRAVCQQAQLDYLGSFPTSIDAAA